MKALNTFLAACTFATALGGCPSRDPENPSKDELNEAFGIALAQKTKLLKQLGVKYEGMQGRRGMNNGRIVTVNCSIDIDSNASALRSQQRAEAEIMDRLKEDYNISKSENLSVESKGIETTNGYLTCSKATAEDTAIKSY